MDFLKRLVYRMPDAWQRCLRRWHYSKKLASAQIGDEAELGAVDLLVEDGQTVMDIGANFGLFTRFLSESVGATGKVFSFEPTKDMFEVLSHNVQKFGFSNTECHHLALSDRSGEAEIYIPKRPDGTLNHYEACLRPVEAGSERIAEKITNRVEIQTVDGFCDKAGIKEVDFIKCDVEGHELSVLRGAEALLRRCHPTILLEVNEPLTDEAHGTEVRELVESYGYTFHVYEDGKVCPWSPGDVRVNYLLLPAEEAS